MPQIKAAKKDMRKNARRRAVNDRWRRKLREAIKSVTDADSLKKAQSVIDRAARHNIIHPNKAARQKAKLAKASAS